MKTLVQHINEWKLNNSTSSNVGFKYKYFPQKKSELIRIIKERLKDNYENPYLLDIDTSKITNMDGLFAYFGSSYSCGLGDVACIEHLDLHTWNVSNVLSMQCLFHGASNVETINIIGWNTSKLTNMNGMFQSCKSIKRLNLSFFDTKNVTVMTHVFSDCKNLTYLNLTNWDIKNVLSAYYMFFRCANLKELKGIEHWNIDKSVNMEDMFYGCDKSIIPSWYKK